MNRILTQSAAFVIALIMFTLLPAALQAKQQPAQPAPQDASAKIAALQTRVQSLQLKKQIDSLSAQIQVLEKQEKASSALHTTDGELAAAQAQMKELQLKAQLEELKEKQSALLNPSALVPSVISAPAGPTTQAKAVSAEDAELQHLNEERQKLLKQQEIARMKAENDKLSAPAQPLPPAAALQQQPCSPQGKLTLKPNPKINDFMCKKLGVCQDNTPVVLNPCPAPIK